jgi:hypothetical protein
MSARNRIAQAAAQSPVRQAVGSARSEVWSWGAGVLGGTGHGSYESFGPQRIAALEAGARGDGSGWASIAAGWARSYAVTNSGQVLWWGWNRSFRHLTMAQRFYRRTPRLMEAVQRIPFGLLTFRAAETTPLFLYGSPSFPLKCID